MNHDFFCRPLPRTLVVTVFLIWFAGCGAGLQPVEKDVEQGVETAKLVEADMGIYTDAEITRYVNDIGRRLLEANTDQTFDYRFAIVDQDAQRRLLIASQFGQIRVRDSEGAGRNATLETDL